MNEFHAKALRREEKDILFAISAALREKNIKENDRIRGKDRRYSKLNY